MDNNVTITQRIASLISVAAIPASIISLLGDLFTPKHGYYFVIALGILSIFLCVYIFFSLLGKNTPWWLNYFNKNSDINWVWVGKNPIYTHGVQSILLFGIVCLFSGCQSYKNKNEGGYLSNNVVAIEEFQSLIFPTLENINISLNEIKIKPNEMKYPWTNEGFNLVLKNSDKNSLELFLKGGWKIDYNSILYLMNNRKSDLLNIIMRHPNNFDNQQCIILFKEIRNHTPISNYNTLIRNICGDIETKRYVKDRLDRLNLEIEKNNEKIKMLDHTINNCIDYIVNDYKDWYSKMSLYGSGSQRGSHVYYNKNSYYHTGGVIERETNELIYNIIDNKHNPTFINHIKSYCEYASKKTIVDVLDKDSFLYPWKDLDKILN